MIFDLLFAFLKDIFRAFFFIVVLVPLLLILPRRARAKIPPRWFCFGLWHDYETLPDNPRTPYARTYRCKHCPMERVEYPASDY